MDAISASAAAAQLAGMLVTIVKKIKEVIETMKGAKKALLELLQRSERMRLVLELFRSLVTKLRDPTERNITLAFNDNACRTTVSDLEALVRKVAGAAKHSDIWMKFNWVIYKSDATAIIAQLQGHEQDINSVLVFIAAHSSAVTEGQLLDLKAGVVGRSQVVDAFEKLRVADVDEGTVSTPPNLHPLQRPPSYSRQDKEDLQSSEADLAHFAQASTVDRSVTSMSDYLQQCSHWLGSVIRANDNTSYYRDRDRLSDAAYRGAWDPLFKGINKGRDLYHESWANAFRLKPVGEINRMSYWAPLHQAAYNCAPVEVVQKLLELGAFRTVRTRYTGGEFQYEDLTPAAIARELGYSHLFDILAPVMRHYIPANDLINLQSHFHDLIRQDMEGIVKMHHHWLPELSVLTELERPEMWFPVKLGEQSSRGWLLRLDGRELLVLSLGKTGSASSQLFRVSSRGWNEIQDAVFFGS